MVHEIIETCSTRVQSKVCSARTTSLDFVHETLLNFFRAYNAPKTPSWIKNLDTLCCNCKQCRFKKLQISKLFHVCSIITQQHQHRFGLFSQKLLLSMVSLFFFRLFEKSPCMHLSIMFASCHERWIELSHAVAI